MSRAKKKRKKIGKSVREGDIMITKKRKERERDTNRAKKSEKRERGRGAYRHKDHIKMAT